MTFILLEFYKYVTYSMLFLTKYIMKKRDLNVTFGCIWLDQRVGNRTRKGGGARSQTLSTKLMLGNADTILEITGK